MTPFLLLMSPTSISRVSVQSRTSGIGLHDWPEHQRFDLPEAKVAAAFDLVLREQALYIWDGTTGAMGLFKLKEAGVTWRGTLFKLRKGSIAAMAVDYSTLNVFWSSTDQPGRLCFSNAELQGTGTRLECTYMDGGNRTVVWDGAINPISLTLSNDGTRLYWADTSLGLITSVRTDGSEHKMLTSEEPIVAFTLASNILVWLTKTDSIKCWFSEDHQTAKMWFKVKTDVLDIKAFHKPSQNGTNLCSSGNGGCSQLCLVFPGGRTCDCGQGFLPTDETSCSIDPRCPSGTKPCLRGEECVPLEKFCNDDPDCADDSDEICVQDQAKSAEGVAPKVRPSSKAPLPPRASAGPALVKKISTSIGLSPKSSHPSVPEVVDSPTSLRPDPSDD
ncbi:hypothetical protein AMELA_G00243160 [Ameiurus melas]|uniref:Uncharacterized protein n=1 Tax=Ameiurus melas TaxID=219545 RepID=A0A7J5ZVY1_AMEME|nr:hypothetical protein AMELA_G00243160 [Ameiurus melas]